MQLFLKWFEMYNFSKKTVDKLFALEWQTFHMVEAWQRNVYSHIFHFYNWWILVGDVFDRDVFQLTSCQSSLHALLQTPDVKIKNPVKPHVPIDCLAP